MTMTEVDSSRDYNHENEETPALTVMFDIDNCILETDKVIEKRILDKFPDIKKKLPEEGYDKIIDTFDFPDEETLNKTREFINELLDPSNANNIWNDLPAIEDSIETLNSLHKQGVDVVLATGRSTTLKDVTRKNLVSLGLELSIADSISYKRQDLLGKDAVSEHKNQVAEVRKAIVNVDDSPENARRLRDNPANTLQSILFTTRQNTGAKEIDDIVRARNWKEVETLVLQIKNALEIRPDLSPYHQPVSK